MPRNEMLGWSMFVVCAVFYMISAVQSGDIFALVGSILFFAACFAFLWPMLHRDN